ncbi:MAG: SH3 domain-containing protein [Chloroflexota bacterium]
MKLIRVLLFLCILIVFSSAKTLVAQEPEPISSNCSGSTLSNDPIPGEFETDTGRLFWKSTGGLTVTSIQELLETPDVGRLGKTIGFSLNIAGVPLEAHLLQRDIDNGKYTVELRDVSANTFIDSHLIESLAHDTVAREMLVWVLKHPKVAPLIAKVAKKVIGGKITLIVAGTIFVAWALDKIGSVDVASHGLAYTVTRIGQLVRQGIEAASGYVQASEIWASDLLTDDKVHIRKNGEKIQQLDSFIDGQCFTFETRLSVAQVATAVGMTEKDFEHNNQHLIYQTGDDGLDYLVYLPDQHLRATLPGGVSMDINELILRVQLGPMDEQSPSQVYNLGLNDGEINIDTNTISGRIVIDNSQTDDPTKAANIFNLCGVFADWHTDSMDNTTGGNIEFPDPDFVVFGEKQGDDLILMPYFTGTDYSPLIGVSTKITLQNFHDGDFGITGTDFPVREEAPIPCVPSDSEIINDIATANHIIESSSLYPDFYCAGAPAPRLTVGDSGQVTPGDSNNLRTEASTSGASAGKIPGGAAFEVLDGPVCADGYVWWQINYDGQVAWTVEGKGTEYWLEPGD